MTGRACRGDGRNWGSCWRRESPGPLFRHRRLFPWMGVAEISTGVGDLIRPSSSLLLLRPRPRRAAPVGSEDWEVAAPGPTGYATLQHEGDLLHDGRWPARGGAHARRSVAGAMEAGAAHRGANGVDRCAARCRDADGQSDRGADRVLAGWGDSVLCARRRHMMSETHPPRDGTLRRVARASERLAL